MPKNIYVGNLPFAATSEDIEASFNEFGQVLSVRIVTDRETGRSKGFAFVEMADDGAGDEAIKALNGAEYLGRQLVVNEARPREERAPGARGPRTGGRGGFSSNGEGRGFQKSGFGRR